MRREGIEPVERAPFTVERAAASHLREPLRADTCLPRLLHGHEAVVVLGDVVEGLEVPTGHVGQCNAFYVILSNLGPLTASGQYDAFAPQPLWICQEIFAWLSSSKRRQPILSSAFSRRCLTPLARGYSDARARFSASAVSSNLPSIRTKHTGQ